MEALMPSMSVARPMSHGTEMQMKTRKDRNFAKVEAALPLISPYTAIKLLDPTHAVNLTSSSRTAALLSYLGTWNPAPVEVCDKDAVWLLDNVAYQDDKGGWEAEFVAAVFAQKPSEKIIEERLVPFVMDIQPAKVVHATFGESNVLLRLGPGGRNGISSDVRNLPDCRPGDVVTTRAQVPKGANGYLDMKTFYADPEGWALVSDIDDTIKITMTSDPTGILRSTFVSTPTPTHGMVDFYKHIQQTLPAGSPFFYLSASPYNLYPFLRGFRDKYYPFGQFILRDASWMSIPGLLSNLTLGTEDYKTDRLQKIHGWLPRKKLILVGDSTQSDPEAYGNTYRAFPGWVHVIFIRKVTDVASLGLAEKNAPERFEKAFRDVPRDVWHLFEDPAECYGIINRVLSRK